MSEQVSQREDEQCPRLNHELDLVWGKNAFIRLAQSQADFNQISLLNHQVYCQELGQYPVRMDRILVDKHHDKNNYIIAEHCGVLCGMISYCFERPFSVEETTGISKVFFDASSIVEVRLLAVRFSYRKHSVFPRLISALWRELSGVGFEVIVAKGLVDILDYYIRLGFEPVGDVVQNGEVAFQPIILKKANLSYLARQIVTRYR